ncbi:MAG: hypothetical protein HRT44_01265 [Bdellovibrionales bacterium]|nr:hypothetical protein [Bdellovibrionales bacterium]NQZ17878.1 hypothetical protein [Bdellovibrionales bacterium]
MEERDFEEKYRDNKDSSSDKEKDLELKEINGIAEMQKKEKGASKNFEKHVRDFDTDQLKQIEDLK